eukprot:5124476-Alexandrium_andersonii.AAC.1
MDRTLPPPSAPQPAASSGGEVVRSANEMVDSITDSVEAGGQAVVDRMMEVVAAASACQGSAFKRSQAIAKVVATFAARLTTTDDQKRKLADLLVCIGATGTSTPAAASAEGGGEGAGAEVPADVSM